MIAALALVFLTVSTIFSSVASAKKAHDDAQTARSQAEANAASAELAAQGYESQQDTVLENIESVENMIENLEFQKEQVLEKINIKGERIVGRQRALYGASGLVLEGSPLELMKETMSNVEKDITQLDKNYNLQKSIYESKIETLWDTHEQLGYAADSARIQGEYYEEAAESIDPGFEAFNSWFNTTSAGITDILNTGLQFGVW